MLREPAWIEIDTGAIRDNLAVVRAELGAAVELCAVIKADAYGHGIELVLPALIGEGVTAIGITSNGEARTARAVGFTGRIMRLRPALREEIEDGAPYDVEEWIGGAAHAHLVADVASGLGRTIAVHVSLNSTGLSRDGLDWGSRSARAAVEDIASAPRVRVVGVCSHFPCEDRRDVEIGTARFRKQAGEVADLLPGAVQRHCATSHAALTVPSSRFDLVRIGAALYGDTQALGVRLRPAMRILARIAAINDYPAGSTVGYERAHRLTTEARIALVPLGYADGYHRALGGRARVLVEGASAPIVDRLAMNALLIDVTHIPDAQIGDEVVLFGRQGSDSITSREIEEQSGQIAADLYAALGHALPKVAVNDIG